ncbi:hypothetical protein BG844_04810 [Couchioplanes caeruleus subsp. caeruleus]|uniref:TniQ protein n=1 Tax=Couchioplanes caeruleus subsp. caeruleus TaxID=56427 RepID=A0A1K0FRF5_9ACTN|nr:hypothetical protein BG844_04810 [Couchioplanes caeruleus subsp. caeruleus]
MFSYVRRLAAANHATPRLLLSHLGRHHSHPKAGGIATSTYDLALNHAALTRLAIYSGSTPAALLKATGAALSTDIGPTPICEWTSILNRRSAFACTRCAPEISPGTGLIALDEHQPAICRTHQAILARAGITGEQQLRPFTEIAAAAHRHHHLHRRRRHTFSRSLDAASALIRRWRPFAKRRAESPEHLISRWHERASRLNLPDTDQLVRYPEMIALAQLFSTLPWPDASADQQAKPIITAPLHFLEQAAVHLAHPEPNQLFQRGHPLCRWADVPERPGYWWRDYGTEPDRSIYFRHRNNPKTAAAHRRKRSDLVRPASSTPSQSN